MKLTPIPVGAPACAPPLVRPLHPDIVPAVIIVVVIVAMVWLALAGLQAAAIGSLLAAAAGAAGHLVRQLRESVTCR